jgi:8-oxo-dGTP pyrophosphatase MutT (NUDIX family)
MTEIRLSAGVVVVRPRHDGHVYLLLRAYRNWDFPKGMVEAGEAPLAAAVREVAEETTLRGLDFRWGTDYRETGPYGHRKVARYYLAESRTGEVDLPVSEEIGMPEHQEYRWLPYEQARELLTDRLKPVIDWARERLLAG